MSARLKRLDYSSMRRWLFGGWWLQGGLLGVEGIEGR